METEGKSTKYLFNELDFNSFWLFNPFLLDSPAYDTYDPDNPHNCGQAHEAQDDCRHLYIGQWEAPKCDQMGHQVEGWSHFPGDSQPKWHCDGEEQLRGGAEPRDPQTEADVYRDVPEWKDHRERGAQRAV